MKPLLQRSILSRAIITPATQFSRLHPYSHPIRHQSTTTTATTSQSAEPPEPTTESFTTQLPNPPNTPSFEPLTYHVHRTPSQQLPIYHLAKAGGNKHQTRIRKISGSVEDLKQDLRLALGLEDKEIVVNGVNGHIVIKGWRKFDVARFLEGKHF